MLPIQSGDSAESSATEEELPLLERVDDEDLSPEFSEQEIEVNTPKPEKDDKTIVRTEEQPLPLSTPLSAVMDIQEQEVVRPVFDPSDPNNLFASLEEITAPVERIKQTDHSEAQSNPLPQEDEASPTPPVENAPTMADSPEAPAPVEATTRERCTGYSGRGRRRRFSNRYYSGRNNAGLSSGGRCSSNGDRYSGCRYGYRKRKRRCIEINFSAAG